MGAYVFRWTREAQHAIYNEIYRWFYQEFPDGPGPSAVETKAKEVEFVPLFFVPQPPAPLDVYPDFELLFVYHQLASNFVDTEKKAKLVLSSRVALNNPAFQSAHPQWFRGLPPMLKLSYEIQMDKDNGMYNIEVNPGFHTLRIPAKTNGDRFALARFLFDCMELGPFSLSIHGSIHEQLNGRNEMKALNELLLTKRRFSFQFNCTGLECWYTIHRGHL